MGRNTVVALIVIAVGAEGVSAAPEVQTEEPVAELATPTIEWTYDDEVAGETQPLAIELSLADQPSLELAAQLGWRQRRIDASPRAGLPTRGTHRALTGGLSVAGARDARIDQRIDQTAVALHVAASLETERSDGETPAGSSELPREFTELGAALLVGATVSRSRARLTVAGQLGVLDIGTTEGALTQSTSEVFMAPRIAATLEANDALLVFAVYGAEMHEHAVATGETMDGIASLQSLSVGLRWQRNQLELGAASFATWVGERQARLGASLWIGLAPTPRVSLRGSMASTNARLADVADVDVRYQRALVTGVHAELAATPRLATSVAVVSAGLGQAPMANIAARYRWRGLEFQFQIDNILDSAWSEGELQALDVASPQDGNPATIHATDGRPLGARLSLTRQF